MAVRDEIESILQQFRPHLWGLGYDVDLEDVDSANKSVQLRLTRDLAATELVPERLEAIGEALQQQAGITSVVFLR